jgi:hypothetical protein
MHSALDGQAVIPQDPSGCDQWPALHLLEVKICRSQELCSPVLVVAISIPSTSEHDVDDDTGKRVMQSDITPGDQQLNGH